MIIDLSTVAQPPIAYRYANPGTDFALMMAQRSSAYSATTHLSSTNPPAANPSTTYMATTYMATPLFSLWPAADPGGRSTFLIAGAALNTHPVSSNRREGRHARE
jgi:hypothetical protein